MSKQILPEDKIRAVKEYLEGRTSQQEQAKKLGVKVSSFQEMVAKYETFGEDGLRKLKKNNQYTAETKRLAVFMLSRPFFNRAISISCFATSSLSRSSSDKFLLLCNAANLFPGRGLGSNAASPPAKYSLLHRLTIPCMIPYSFPSFLMEICSSKCLCTISSFCSFVHTRFVWPFLISSPPYTLILP